MSRIDCQSLWGETTLVRVGNSIGWLHNDGWERVEIEQGEEGAKLLKIYPDGQVVAVAMWEIDR